MRNRALFSTMLSEEGSRFNEDIAFKLTLEAEGNKSEILSGHIEGVNFDLSPYGFNGSVHFCGFDDEALDSIITSDKTIQLTLSCSLWTSNAKTPTPLLELKGLVTDKFFKKVKRESKDQMRRHYEVHFSDIAKVIWDHHFPISIYVNKSMKEVIQDQENSLINIKYDWSVLEQACPILAFALMHKEFRSDHEEVSFYSFLMWYLYRENGILSYDYKENSYSIIGKKDDGGAKPSDLVEWWVDPPICRFPEPPRFKERVLNHTCDKLSEETRELFAPYESIRRDLFDIENSRIYPEQPQVGCQSDLSMKNNEVRVTFKAFDKTFSLGQIIPGQLLTFKGDQKTGGTWSQDAQLKGKVFRVKHLAVRAVKLTRSEDIKKSAQPYSLRVGTLLEDQEETYVSYPPFQSPIYPFYIQGTVVSKIGDEAQSTFEIDEQVPRGQYLIEVPLVGNDEERVVVPFTPNIPSGQYYFPFNKGEKVLLSMSFQTAKIERVLDWQPLTQLPSGIQGNQIVLASNGKDYYTLLRHEFEDGNHSVFTIEQSSSDSQKRIIELRDETITQTVVSPKKKTITVIYNEDSGSMLKVEDHASGITQETTFDGEAMTHKCSSSSESSEIVQKSDSIEIDCKTFTVNSEDINLIAKNNIIQKGATKVDIDTQIASVKAPTVKLGG